MSSLDDSGAIFRYHRDMISMHGGESSLALGWKTAQDQQVRFEALGAIADLTGKTVLDAGCGYADFFAYLPPLKHYYGIEQIPELLDEAIARYGSLPNTTFISGNFLDHKLSADYVFASGSLNYGSSDPDFIYKAISILYRGCSCGLGFNLLKSVPDNGYLVAYEPGDIVAYCRTLSNKVILKEAYAAGDFTILMYQ